MGRGCIREPLELPLLAPGRECDLATRNATAKMSASDTRGNGKLTCQSAGAPAPLPISECRHFEPIAGARRARSFHGLPISWRVALRQCVQESDEISDLIFPQAAVKCGHRAQALDDGTADLFVSCRCAARKSCRCKHLIEFWWLREEVAWRIVMTLRAMQLVQRPSCNLLTGWPARTAGEHREY